MTRFSVAAFLLVLCGCTLVFCEEQRMTAFGTLMEGVDDTGVDISHPMRISNRREDPLEEGLADRASLLFRSMDHDKDKKLSEEDVRQSKEQLQLHMPGVGVDEFLSFMQLVDKNGDKMLDREELMQGIADGLTEAQSPTLLETEAKADRRGIFDMAKNAFNTVKGAITRGAGNLMRKVTGGVDTSNDGCVMCQYIVERCETNVKQSGVIPSLSQMAAFDSYLEVESQQLQPNYNQGAQFSPFVRQPMLETPMRVQVQNGEDPRFPRVIPAVRLEDDHMSLLEVESKSQDKQLYFDQTAAGIIGSTRQSTRVQRQLERQKYNEIYRVVDITLDDVCEQGMPNSFYGYCKQVYKMQSDVVDGLRYQYRPTDICFRVGMCGKSSYITKGIHSRYK